MKPTHLEASKERMQEDDKNLQAQTQWFHVFKDMIDSGDFAKLPGSAVKVYMVIKSHINFSTGQAFPSMDTIVEKAGISLAQVKRELKTLEDFGYVSKSKQGRNNTYTLREKVEISDKAGMPTAVATWDYVPSAVKEAVSDLKNVLVTGDLAGAKVVLIERLQINMNTGDHATNINVQQFMADLDKLPKGMRDKLLSAWVASREAKAES